VVPGKQIEPDASQDSVLGVFVNCQQATTGE